MALDKKIAEEFSGFNLPALKESVENLESIAIRNNNEFNEKVDALKKRIDEIENDFNELVVMVSKLVSSGKN